MSFPLTALILAFNVHLSTVICLQVVILIHCATMVEIPFTLFLAYLQLCDFGFARAMSANTVVLRSIKGIYFSSSLVAEILTNNFHVL